MPATLIGPLFLLLGAAIAIYAACGFFVNGVEWLGRRLAIGSTATATVLAAFGTALPESIVTLVAVAWGGPDGRALGIGAALGGPLALATIAYGVVGLGLLLTGRKLGIARGEAAVLRRDQRWFLLLFAAKIALGLVVFSGKGWAGLGFVAAYLLYLRVQLRARAAGAEDETLARLRFDPDAPVPAGWRVWTQTLAALAVIFVASRLFVGQLGALGPALGLSPQLVALLLSPIATELPETMNAIIWVRAGKQRLALANISGAMMIQATVPTAFGLFFTPWLLEPPLLIGAGVTVAAMSMLYWGLGRGASRRLLAAGGLFYLVFVALLLVLRP